MNEEVATEEVEDAAVAEEVEAEVIETVDTETEKPEETEDGEAEVKAEKEEPEPSESSAEKKDGVQKRIDELTKIRRETERDRDYWKNLAQTNQVAPDPVEPGKTLADFEYDEGKYATYLKDEAKADAKAEVDLQLHNDRQARARADFSSREADFSKNLDDYHIVTRSNDLKITEPMLEAMQGSDEAPAVLYYLGKNPEVAERLSTMAPLAMARELGRIEATKLVKEKAPSVSTAPRPVPKLAATDAKTTISIADPKISDAQFRKIRLKQIANR